MVYYSPAALLSLTALTFHLSLLSSVLYVSRSSSYSRYNASSAVVLTELIKIVVSILLVFASGELEERAKEWKALRRRRSNEEEEQREREQYVPMLAEVTGRFESPRISDSFPHDDVDIKRTRSFSRLRRAMASPISSPLVGKAGSRRDSMDSSIPLVDIPPNSVTLASQRRSGSVSSLASSVSASLDSSSPVSLPLSPSPSRSYLQRLADLSEPDYWLSLQEMVGRGIWTVAIPAVLFAFQANIQYIASTNLSVPISQLLFQLKIPATAMFSILLLKRKLHPHQWFSLFILTLGVCILLRASDLSSTSSPASILADKASDRNTLLGASAVIASCLSSGFASTYFERLLRIDSSSSPAFISSSSKDGAGAAANISSPPTSPTPATVFVPVPPLMGSASLRAPSLWIRNIQLSLFGILTTLPVVFYEIQASGTAATVVVDQATGIAGREGWNLVVEMVRSGFFKGFSPIAWVVIALQVIGGLIGALVIHHADNIAKGFATSLSILLSIACSIWMFDFKLSPSLFVGATFVLAATALYSRASVSFSLRK